jgi:hypothetical protein
MALDNQQITDFANTYDQMAIDKDNLADQEDIVLEAGFLRSVAAAYRTLSTELRKLL